MHRPIVVSRALGKVVVSLYGDVDAQTLGQTLTDLVNDQGNLALVIDLRHTNSVDSRGVAVLVQASHRLDRHAGELVLSGPSPELCLALQSAGLTVTGREGRRGVQPDEAQRSARAKSATRNAVERPHGLTETRHETSVEGRTGSWRRSATTSKSHRRRWASRQDLAW